MYVFRRPDDSAYCWRWLQGEYISAAVALPDPGLSRDSSTYRERHNRLRIPALPDRSAIIRGQSQLGNESLADSAIRVDRRRMGKSGNRWIVGDSKLAIIEKTFWTKVQSQ